MKTYRVSNVEAFRQYEQDEEMELAEVLERMQWNGKASPAMLAGTAFHRVLEDAIPGVALDEAESLGHRFVFGADLAVEVAPIREMRAGMTFVVDGEPIRISGQVDALDGLRIDDHKTTGRFDPERYIGGCQWKLYCLIFGAKHFRWNVFEIAELSDEDMPTYEVRAAHRVEQFAYPGMADEMQSLVQRFARFVRLHVDGAQVAPAALDALSAAIKSGSVDDVLTQGAAVAAQANSITLRNENAN